MNFFKTIKDDQEVKALTDDHKTKLKTLKASTTWMRGNLIICFIKRQQDKLCVKTKTRHEKKLDSLIINKHINEGIHQNPNRIITTFSDIALNDNEVSVLKLGLKHDILIRPKEKEMTVIMEDIYDQIVRKDLSKKDNISKYRLKLHLSRSLIPILI